MLLVHNHRNSAFRLSAPPTALHTRSPSTQLPKPETQPHIGASKRATAKQAPGNPPLILRSGCNAEQTTARRTSTPRRHSIPHIVCFHVGSQRVRPCLPRPLSTPTLQVGLRAQYPTPTTRVLSTPTARAPGPGTPPQPTRRGHQTPSRRTASRRRNRECGRLHGSGLRTQRVPPRGAGS